jgi:hypothetical protein
MRKALEGTDKEIFLLRCVVDAIGIFIDTQASSQTKMDSFFLLTDYVYTPERLQCDGEDHLDILVYHAACFRIQLRMRGYIKDDQSNSSRSYNTPAHERLSIFNSLSSIPTQAWTWPRS